MVDLFFDETTANWPVTEDMREDLNQLMATHAAQPLPVFKDDLYVRPAAVNSTLKDSLVEVHFAIKHYRIQKRDSKPIDSFTGLVEQVIILKSGEPRAQNSYKRKNLLDGPYRPKPFKDLKSSLTSVALHTPARVPVPVLAGVLPAFDQRTAVEATASQTHNDPNTPAAPATIALPASVTVAAALTAVEDLDTRSMPTLSQQGLLTPTTSGASASKGPIMGSVAPLSFVFAASSSVGPTDSAFVSNPEDLTHAAKRGSPSKKTSTAGKKRT